MPYFQEGAPPKVTLRKYIDKIFGELFHKLMPANLAALEKKITELGMDKIYVDRIQKWKTSMIPSIVRATDKDYYPDDFHTVCHADPWLNNMLFTYDDQKQPKDVRFVSEF